MANENAKTEGLVYRGHPLRRIDNLIYYGTMAEKYIIMMQVQDTKKVQDLDVASKVSVQLQLMDPNLKSRDRIVKKSEKDSLYAAMDIAGQDTASQLLFAGCRFTLSGLMTLAVLGILRRKLPLPKKEGAVRRVGTLALSQTVIQYVCFYIGVAHTSGTNTAIINGCNAFITIISYTFNNNS